MPVFRIESPDDKRLRPYRALPQANHAGEQRLFITEGDKVTERLFGSRYQPHSLLLEEPWVERFERLAGPDLPIYVVERGLMSQTVGFKFHRGVMGCGQRGKPATLSEVVPPRKRSCLLAVCPELHDPTNLGTIIRTALAFRVDALILGPGCADYLSRRVVRVSMGAALHLPIAECSSHDELDKLRNEFHVQLCATVLDDAAEPLETFAPVSRTALLFGSEGHGLPDDVIARCDRRLTIPMPANTDSLNAAVAAGIFLHHCSAHLRRASGT
jgi:tRNA G18 (ribose-2'-O)-methylase SpoU